MDSATEYYIRSVIFPELERGRPHWDVPHTQEVVRKLREILQASFNIKADEDVLLLAAYTHDWGYADLWREGEPLNREMILQAKSLHMTIGAEKVQQFLQEPVFDYLTVMQKERVVHLVAVHDLLDVLQEEDELILMEADTLGGIDIEHIQSTFSREENEKDMSDKRTKRLPKFITDFGKNEFERLYVLRMQYYGRLGIE